MKKILFAAGITVIGLSAAFAQEVKQATPVRTQQNPGSVRARDGQQRVSPEIVAQKKTDRLNTQLGFTDDQKKKVYELFLKESKENQGRVSQNQELDAQLKTIFNDEQNKKYEAMKAERKQMMMQRSQSPRSAELKSPTPIQ